MKKILSIAVFFLVVSAVCWAGGNKETGASSTAQQEARKAQQKAEQEAYEAQLKAEWEARKAQEPPQEAHQKPAQPAQSEPFTEADFKYRQNQQGGITIINYIPRIKGIRETAAIPAQIQGINVTEIGERAFARGSYADGYYNGTNGNYRFVGMSDDEQIFENVIIPPTVTSIGAEAFIGRGIKTLTLPESVRSIGHEAFAENQLSSVTLPSSITIIPSKTFARNQLTSIVIPSRVTEIGNGAFGGNQLTELTIPANVTRINAYAFAANNISKLTFSNSGKLKSIGSGAFSNNNLKSVVLPEGLEAITDSEDTRIESSYGTSYLGDYFGVGYVIGIFSGNPLGYIKIPSRLNGDITGDVVTAIEWLQPGGGIRFSQANAVKVGANLNIRRQYVDDAGVPGGAFITGGAVLDDGFANFYVSQGKKAGIYFRRGQIWVMGTQAEFDALIAEITK